MITPQMMGGVVRPMRRTLVVILVASIAWLPHRLTAQVRLADTEVGIYFGFRFTEGFIDQERLGGQVVVPFFGPVEFVGSFGVFTNFPGAEGGAEEFSGTAWEAFLTVGARPLGRHSALILGYGLVIAHSSIDSTGFGVGGSSTETSDAGLIGVEVPLKRVRPFSYLYLVNLLNRGSAVGGFWLLGLNVVLQ